MLSRTIRIEGRYLNMPADVGHDDPAILVRLFDGTRLLREFQAALSAAPQTWIFADVGPCAGKELTLTLEGPAASAEQLALCYTSDVPHDAGSFYQEALRPAFHFTARRGWLNDPNGLLYYQGVYHLFFQHNPYGSVAASWGGGLQWGHAISRDLLHWEELGAAIEPDAAGQPYSGSGIVDRQNVAGLRAGPDDPLLLFYTIAGNRSPQSMGQPFCQGLAYSADGGRTFTQYPHNPVVPKIESNNRDPKVIWHAPSRQWVMVLYLASNDFAFLTSTDLLHWTLRSRIDWWYSSECPDLFELPVDGDPTTTKWVLWGGNSHYLVGDFDGARFLPAQDALVAQGVCGGIGADAALPKVFVKGAHIGIAGQGYAAQTFSDIPAEDGRRIQIAWLVSHIPAMPFNQMLLFPCELSLQTRPAGLRLCFTPAREIARLHGAQQTARDIALAAGQSLSFEGECMDILLDVEAGATARRVTLDVRGAEVVWDAAEQRITCLGVSAPLSANAGRLAIRALVDRTSIELFADGGAAYLAHGHIFDRNCRRVAISAEGDVRVRSADVFEMQDIWGV